MTVLSCDLFKQEDNRKVVAKVNDHYLYNEDIEKVLPKGLSKKDSISYSKNFIEQWAMDKIIIDKARFNLPQDEQDRYNDMVNKYRSELFKKAYLNALVQKQVDAYSDSIEVFEYYEKNKENFKINEHLLKLRYIYAKNDLKDLKEIKKRFKRFEVEDQDYLLDKLFKLDKVKLNDSVWVRSLDVFKNLKELTGPQQQSLLSKNTYAEFVDSLGTHIIYVKDVLNPNSTAPVSYIKPTIEQILNNKKELKLKSELKRQILNDAIKNNDYEVFE